MRLWTDAVNEQGELDARYTCDIDNSSPELRWENPPEATRSYILLAESDEAGSGEVFPHWLVYAIPREILHLPAGIPPQDTLPNGIRQGLNGFGRLGYAGPCPPRDRQSHRYVFRLLALSDTPGFLPRMSRQNLLQAIDPLIIAEARVEALYRRAIERAG